MQGSEIPRPMGFQPPERRPALPSGRPLLVSPEILMSRPTADPQIISQERTRQYRRLIRFKSVDMSSLGIVLERPMYQDSLNGNIFVPTVGMFKSKGDIERFQKGVRTGLSVLYAESNLHRHESGLVG